MARGTIISRTLKDGKTKRYYAALWVQEPDKPRKQVWKTFEKKKQAERYLDEESKAVREGEYSEPEKVTFEQFANEWLEKYPRQESLKPSTVRGYRSIIRKHFIPFFSQILVSQIRSSDIEKDLKAKLYGETVTNEKGKERHIERSAKMVRNALIVLQLMLKTASRWRYLRTNPFHDDKVSIPPVSREQKGRALKPEEITKLLDKCLDDTHMIVTTALLTGMRRGELLAVRWKDVDWEKDQIHVRQTIDWERDKDHPEEPAFTFFTPKTKASRRDIDMSPRLRALLRQHQIASKPNPYGLVFATSEREPIHPDWLYKDRFLPAVEAAKIGHCRLHDLRHTFGSLKIDQGENLLYVRDQMGHSSIQVTADIYGHKLKAQNPEAAARTDALIFGKKAANR